MASIFCTLNAPAVSVNNSWPAGFVLCMGWVSCVLYNVSKGSILCTWPTGSLLLLHLQIPYSESRSRFCTPGEPAGSVLCSGPACSVVCVGQAPFSYVFSSVFCQVEDWEGKEGKLVSVLVSHCVIFVLFNLHTRPFFSWSWSLNFSSSTWSFFTESALGRFSR